MILAGDLGGTKAVLGLFEERGPRVHLMREATFASQQYARFEDLLQEFVRESPPDSIRTACLAVAGPVSDGRVRGTNLAWALEESVLSRTLGGAAVRLVNDLEATAYGVLALGAEEFSVLNPPADPARRGNVAVIAAGTGLGEAMLYWDGKRHHAIASEGGHADFAPRNDQEISLLRYLLREADHVSYERVLSGPGLHTIYLFLRDSGVAPEPPWLAAALREGDPSAAISRFGLANEAPLCVAALDLFCSIYGAEAGNLALKCMATEVIVAGGIAPKMRAVLESGKFMEAFTGKGRFAEHLKRIGVRIALNPGAALLGAAHLARTL